MLSNDVTSSKEYADTVLSTSIVPTVLQEYDPQNEVQVLQDYDPQNEVQVLQEYDPQNEVQVLQDYDPQNEVQVLQEYDPQNEVQVLQEYDPQNEVQVLQEYDPQNEVQVLQEYNPQNEVQVLQEYDPQNEVQSAVTHLQPETSEVTNCTEYFQSTPVIQPTLESMCSGDKTFGFYDIQNCGTPSRENEDSFELQEYNEITQVPFSYEVAVETQKDETEHNYAVSNQDEVPKANHHHGKLNIDYKPKKRDRQLSMYKRRPTLLKKAFELHSITGADVFCLVQEPNGHRYYYGSGELKTKFQTEGLKSRNHDEELTVQQTPDKTLVVEPSPSRTHPSQTYLPAALRSVKPQVTSKEQVPVKLPSPKPKSNKKKLVFEGKTPQDIPKISTRTTQTKRNNLRSASKKQTKTDAQPTDKKMQKAKLSVNSGKKRQSTGKKRCSKKN